MPQKTKAPAKQTPVEDLYVFHPKVETVKVIGRLKLAIEESLKMQQYIVKLMNDPRFISPTERYLKVGEELSNRKMANGEHPPALRLQGIWLHEAGFIRHQYAKIVCVYGMLILIPVAEPLNQP